MPQPQFMYNKGGLEAQVIEIKGSHSRLETLLTQVQQDDNALLSKGKQGWESDTQREYQKLQTQFRNAYREFNLAFEKLRKQTEQNGMSVEATERKLLGSIT